MINKTKVVVTGASGLVGTAILEEAKNILDLQIIPWYRSKPIKNYNQYIQADLYEISSWKQQLKELKPKVLVHCAAQSHVDRCAEDEKSCKKANVDAVQELVKVCNELNIHFIFLSSDFIFDGSQLSYTENSVSNPVNYYGETKVMAENHIIQHSKSWSIVRTILVYGYSPTLKRNNILTWVVNSLANHQPIRVVVDQYRMPTYANDLAKGILKIAAQQIAGVFHLSGSEQLSVFQFTKLIAKSYKLNESLITGIKTSALQEQNKRPPKTGFKLQKASIILGYEPLKIRTALKKIPLEGIRSLSL